MGNPELTAEPSISVRNLSYKFPDGSEGLKDLNLDLPAGSRTLLIGGMSYPVLCIVFIQLVLCCAVYAVLRIVVTENTSAE